MIKLLRFLKTYKKESILAPLFKMLEASFELLVPVVMAYIIDVGIVNQDKMMIFRLGWSIDIARIDWTHLFHYGAVLFSEGSSWICNQASSCTIFAYTKFVV